MIAIRQRSRSVPNAVSEPVSSALWADLEYRSSWIDAMVVIMPALLAVGSSLLLRGRIADNGPQGVLIGLPTSPPSAQLGDRNDERLQLSLAATLRSTRAVGAAAR